MVSADAILNAPIRNKVEVIVANHAIPGWWWNPVRLSEYIDGLSSNSVFLPTEVKP